MKCNITLTSPSKQKRIMQLVKSTNEWIFIPLSSQSFACLIETSLGVLTQTVHDPCHLTLDAITSSANTSDNNRLGKENYINKRKD